LLEDGDRGGRGGRLSPGVLGRGGARFFCNVPGVCMQGSYPRLILSALRGSSGKTLLTLGLLRRWRAVGRTVAPFKKGPDYIDSAWHGLASGGVCRNLDTYLMGAEGVVGSFVRHAAGSGLSVIEGNRGLYDGVDALGTHSTAELSRLLRSPVILVVDCRKVTRTVAAMVQGCREFEEGVEIGGVILNRVGGGRHEGVLRATIERYGGVPVLGALPRVRDGRFPERHLGLLPPGEHPEAERAIESAAELVGRYVELDRLEAIASSAPPLEGPVSWGEAAGETGVDRPRIGVARDSAFGFYYPENLESLAGAGAELVEVSPLGDGAFPLLDGLYIGGGFPETHARELSGNAGFRAGLREAVEAGLPVYAECGGLMYLGEGLEVNGTTYPMVGALPVRFGVERGMQGHGYTRVEVTGRTPYFSEGEELVGHEFHYSRPLSWREAGFEYSFSMRRGRGFSGGRDGLCVKNVLATYTHLHALGAPGWAESVVSRAREWKGARAVARVSI